jgi:hypothetical protein
MTALSTIIPFADPNSGGMSYFAVRLGDVHEQLMGSQTADSRGASLQSGHRRQNGDYELNGGGWCWSWRNWRYSVADLRKEVTSTIRGMATGRMCWIVGINGSGQIRDMGQASIAHRFGVGV